MTAMISILFSSLRKNGNVHLHFSAKMTMSTFTSLPKWQCPPSLLCQNGNIAFTSMSKWRCPPSRLCQNDNVNLHFSVEMTMSTCASLPKWQCPPSLLWQNDNVNLHFYARMLRSTLTSMWACPCPSSSLLCNGSCCTFAPAVESCGRRN